MSISQGEGNSPVTTSQRKAGKPGAGSHTRHDQAASPNLSDVKRNILTFEEK